MPLMTIFFAAWFLAAASIPLLGLFGLEQAVVAIYANIATVLAYIAAAAFCLSQGQALKKDSKDSLANVWLLLGFGLLFWGIGQGVYTYYVLTLAGEDPPYPSLADVFFIVQPFLTFVAFLLLATQWSLHRRIPMLVVIGTLLVFVTAAALGFALRGAYWQDSTPFFVIADSLYILPDAFMVAAATFAALLLNQDRYWWWLLGGVSLMYVGNTAFTYFDYQGSYQSGGWVDSIWIFAGLCFALGAFYSRNKKVTAKNTIKS